MLMLLLTIHTYGNTSLFHLSSISVLAERRVFNKKDLLWVGDMACLYSHMCHKTHQTVRC
jgi:hypothetical protein